MNYEKGKQIVVNYFGENLLGTVERGLSAKNLIAVRLATPVDGYDKLEFHESQVVRYPA
jgi:hypothetical protein